MKKVLIVFVLALFGYTIHGQNLGPNVQDGFAAGGYDVVAYFNNEATAGSKKHTLTHEGIRYKFSSRENLALFQDNPNRYIPQHGGYCSYAMAINGETVSINPKTFEIRNGKLYLFYNAWGTNTLKKWLAESPTELVKKADANWAEINE